MAYRDFKDLAKRTAADKVLRDKAFNIVRDSKYNGHQRGLASMVYNFFDEKTAGHGIRSLLQNGQLAEELHKSVIRKLKKRKVNSTFIHRFIRTLKNNIYKYMTSVSKNVYIGKLDDIVSEYKNTYQRTIKMKPIDVNDNICINICIEVNDKILSLKLVIM